MLNALVRPVPAFLVRSSLGRATCFSSTTKVLLAGKGFGQAPKKQPADKPPQEPAKDQAVPKKARSLMPMADEAASKLKLLAKEGADGTVKFDNPAVGDFQVLDALVEVRSDEVPRCNYIHPQQQRALCPLFFCHTG